MTDAQTLDAAILRTVLYADVFNFALTVRELHHYLLSRTPATLADIEAALTSSTLLKGALARSDELVALNNRPELFTLRREREAMAQVLWQPARRYAQVLGRLPFVRMVALTGALAMRNPSDPRDDLDYLIVTQPGRVWLARLLTVAVVRWVKLRGIVICPNFVLAEDALAQNRRDVYIAHEVTQAVPFYNAVLYGRLREENRWTFAHLPNADGAFHADEPQSAARGGGRLKRALEWLLSGRLGDKIEAWEKARKIRRFAQAAHGQNSTARVDSTQVKGHFNDHGGMVIAQFRRRLAEFGLPEIDETEIAAD